MENRYYQGKSMLFKEKMHQILEYMLEHNFYFTCTLSGVFKGNHCVITAQYWAFE